MRTSEEIKKTVNERYSAIALQEKSGQASACCGTACCTADGEAVMADDYSKVKGYQPEADLGLGCGLPVEYAGIRKGDVVADLGSGAGNDSFIAAVETGPTGSVIGVDMSEAMISRARRNAEKLKAENIEFLLGEIENLPVASASVDTVISNCVLNLVPDKNKAFAEINRILKPGGHFSVSDIVMEGTFPPAIMEAAELYAGCVAGAIAKSEYLRIIADNGFKNVSIRKEKQITLPDELLLQYMNQQDLDAYKQRGTGIFSITVYAEKAEESCCNKDTCCK